MHRVNVKKTARNDETINSANNYSVEGSDPTVMSNNSIDGGILIIMR